MKSHNLSRNCLKSLVIVAIFFALLFIFKNRTRVITTTNNILQTNLTNTNWETKYKYPDNDNKYNAEVLLVKRWNEKAIYERYNEIFYNSHYYYANGGIVEKEYLDNFIQKVIIVGYDDNKNANFINADLYNVRSISNKCAIIVNFENDNNYYIYINDNYKVNTTKDILDDLSILDTISFDEVLLRFESYDNNNKTIDNVEFEDVDPKAILPLLFNNSSIIDEKTNDVSNFVINIQAHILNLGNAKVTINVLSNGYAILYFFNKEIVIDIGKDETQNLVNYIVNNYKGYKIVYVENKNEIKSIKNIIN